MKTFFFLILTSVLFITDSHAQNGSFGITAGFLNISGKVEVENNDVNTADKSGAFAGVEMEFVISDKFHFQPELLYARNKDYGLLMLPMIIKFYPVNKFNIQLGPQLDYSTDPYPIEDVLGFAQEQGFDIKQEDFSRLGISLAAGLGYDINEHFFVDSRYTFQINDVYKGDLNISIKGHIFNAGIGYRF